MKQIAILGPTASGKTDLAIELAHKVNANILSLDSLSIYKEVDIVSAKPTKEEQEGIPHFGIDVLQVDEYFSAATFFDVYHEAKKESEKAGKHLIIVGGTSFYLKAMMEGLSPKPNVMAETKQQITNLLENLSCAYEKIASTDPNYANKIKPTDRYRIEKWYEIYLETGLPATTYYENEKRAPVLEDIALFEIDVPRETLRERISHRTQRMIDQGLIDEVFMLEKKYTRKPNPMKAIGIIETLKYLDGQLSLADLHKQISVHTAQLAKRQSTFNTSQFPKHPKLLKDDLAKKISNII